VRICPLDPNSEARLENKQTSYVISGYITSSSQAASVLEYRKLKAPSRTITVCEGSNQRSVSNLGAEHTHPWNWFSAANVSAGTVWTEALKEIQPDQHMGDSANYLFADAHVETISTFDIRRRAEAGDNFALPENGGTQ
jgi:prepilin-type processing-associated H-X9-DG protein